MNKWWGNRNGAAARALGDYFTYKRKNWLIYNYQPGVVMKIKKIHKGGKLLSLLIKLCCMMWLLKTCLRSFSCRKCFCICQGAICRLFIHIQKSWDGCTPKALEWARRKSNRLVENKRGIFSLNQILSSPRPNDSCPQTSKMLNWIKIFPLQDLQAPGAVRKSSAQSKY